MAAKSISGGAVKCGRWACSESDSPKPAQVTTVRFGQAGGNRPHVRNCCATFSSSRKRVVTESITRSAPASRHSDGCRPPPGCHQRDPAQPAGRLFRATRRSSRRSHPHRRRKPLTEACSGAWPPSRSRVRSRATRATSGANRCALMPTSVTAIPLKMLAFLTAGWPPMFRGAKNEERGKILSRMRFWLPVFVCRGQGPLPPHFMYMRKCRHAS